MGQKKEGGFRITDIEVWEARSMKRNVPNEGY